MIRQISRVKKMEETLLIWAKPCVSQRPHRNLTQIGWRSMELEGDDDEADNGVMVHVGIFWNMTIVRRNKGIFWKDRFLGG